VSQYDVDLLKAIEEGALGGHRLRDMQPGLAEDAVLARLGRVATAVTLARGRLETSGFNQRLGVRQARNKAAAAARAKAAGTQG
jgi:hypothetical protein